MNVLIIKNIAAEGPGTIEDYLRSEAIPYAIVDLGRGEGIPDPNTVTHLVIMGGPMAVYEMDQHPYLRAEAKLIEQSIKGGKRVLGVCLGAQMVAHALGARVYAGEQKEIGWYKVALTPEGMKDPLLSALALDGSTAAAVFQWHGDTFDLPSDAVRLASSPLYPNQAFRYKDRVYALQFHIEVTPAIVTGWLRNEKGIDLAGVDAASNRIYAPYRERATKFYRSFFKRS